jgi:PAS domain S-box-containing protein
MSRSNGDRETELLVATDDLSFGSAVVDAVTETGVAANIEQVEPVTGDLRQHDTDDVEGAIVDGKLAESATVVEHLTEGAGLPVVLLSDSAGDDDTIDRAISAGATDVFPRTAASAQCQLIVERLVATDPSGSTQSLSHEDTTYKQAYQALFENISDGLVVHDPATGEIIDVNGRFCDMNGYERSELLGESIQIVLTDQEAYGPEAAKEMIQRARTEGPQRFEWRNQHRDGETFPVEVDLTVIELGDAERVLASVRDITERRRREREYEQIFNGVKDAIAVFDPDTGEITEVNEPYHDMVGYDDLEKIQELGIEGLSAGGEEYTGERGEALIREVSETGEPMTVEWEAETASGDRRYLDVTLSPAAIRGEQRVLSIQRDITERRRREQEFEQIFNGVQDAIAVHDSETGEMIEVNDAFCELVGYDRETVLKLGTEGVSVDEEGYTVERSEEIIEEVMDGEQMEPFEWKVETKQGEHRVIEVVATTAEIGGEMRFLSINRDITERKRREREYEQIFNGVNDSITIHDPETGALLNVNDALCDLIGHDRSEIIENGIMEYTPTEQGYTAEEAKEFIREVVETGEPKRTEWAVETADGEIRQLEVTGTTVEIGGELRYVAIDRDVTERKRREREFEQIFDGVQDAIVVLDPDTVEILDANEAYLDMLGYEDIDEIRERGVSGLSITEEGYTEQRGREINQRVAASGQPETLEWQSETRSGERIWLGVKIAPAVIGGQQRTIAIHRDITERKRREQRLEVFNRILRHNLRNKLDVIRSHAEELVDRTTDDHATHIIEAVSKLAAIGRRARQIDRIMSRDETLQEVDVVETLRGSIDTMQPTQSEVNVTTEFPAAARLWTDEETVRLAAESALENAFEHAAETVTVTVEARSEECRIAIGDDGPGIPADALVPIEAEHETTFQHGTGLGLWQLRWSVNKLNGELSFDTEDGTTVSIAVPDRRRANHPD